MIVRLLENKEHFDISFHNNYAFPTIHLLFTGAQNAEHFQILRNINQEIAILDKEIITNVTDANNESQENVLHNFNEEITENLSSLRIMQNSSLIESADITESIEEMEDISSCSSEESK